ncbi:hypothetical protein LCGC14_2689260 [marine sediment metagenome]|uniref:Uncharacterized protein n=1 Tax=marine sediment metagenome TaxID=412755 RepID=A0A0F9BTQ6_9ZZZZ
MANVEISWEKIAGILTAVIALVGGTLGQDSKLTINKQ